MADIFESITKGAGDLLDRTTDAMSGMGGSITQGAERMMAQTVGGLTSGQIDMLEGLQEKYPRLNDIDKMTLMTAKSAAPLKQDLLKMLENPEVAESFGRQIQENEGLVPRLNVLIKSDPEQLRTILGEVEKDPASLSARLTGSVSAEQVAQAEQDTGFDMKSMFSNFDFKDLFGKFGNFDNLGNMLGKGLLFIVNKIYAMTEMLCDGLVNMIKSPELVASGNGLTSPDGPLQQIGTMLGVNPTVHTEGPDGALKTASLAQHATPLPEPAAQPSIPAPDRQAPQQPV